MRRTVKCLSLGILMQTLVFLLLLPFLSSAIGADQVSPDDVAAYKAALEDTKETTQSEIVKDLLAVIPRSDSTNYRRLSGDDIIWEDPNHPDKSRLLVVAFMSSADYEAYYEPYMGKASYILQKSLWVTVAPEMRNFFIGKTCPPSKERIIQLLGLHPTVNSDYNVLLEMWVDPGNLFRPCPDPEITDHESELATRVGSSEYWIYPSDMNPFIQIDPFAVFQDNAWTVSQNFKEWYRDRAKNIYNTEGDISQWGWPWTRLGYTYDWGNPDNHAGISEFIIRIDPYEGFANVTLVRAINFDESPEEWGANFRCGPAAPMLAVSKESGRIDLLWNVVPDAEGYYVKYKAAQRGVPFTPPFEEGIEIDVGNANEFTCSLPSGSCYYVAVQPYNQMGRGGISDIRYIYIP